MDRTKNNNQAKWFVGLFLVIILIMILASQKKNSGLTIIPMPQNKGIPVLMSTENQLIAAESGGGFFIFEWSNLQDGPKRFPSASENAVLLLNQNPPVSLSYVSRENALLFLEESGRPCLKITNREKPQQAYIITSPDSNLAYLVNMIRTDLETGYVFYDVKIDKEYLGFLCDLQAVSSFKLQACAASNSGMLAVSGKRHNSGYLAVVDVNDQKVVWEKQVADFSDFSSLSFSADGKLLFVGSEEGSLVMVDVDNGNFLKKVTLVDQPRGTTNSRTIQSVVTGSKGRWVACACDPEVFILDQTTGALYKTLISSHKIVTGLTFSPDETKLATSDLRASGTINIIDIELAESKE